MTKMKNMQKCKKRKNHQKQYIRNFFFLQNPTKKKMEKIAFCVITFDQIKVQTHSAPQNDRLNFSFVEDIHVVREKKARNGRKTTIDENVTQK